MEMIGNLLNDFFSSWAFGAFTLIWNVGLLVMLTRDILKK